MLPGYPGTASTSMLKEPPYTEIYQGSTRTAVVAVVCRCWRQAAPNFLARAEAGGTDMRLSPLPPSGLAHYQTCRVLSRNDKKKRLLPPP